jgi:hypothetical protein
LTLKEKTIDTEVKEISKETIKEKTMNQVKLTATGLWNNDESIVTKEKMAAWLGQA